MGEVERKVMDEGMPEILRLVGRRLYRNLFKPIWYLYKLKTSKSSSAVPVNEDISVVQKIQNKEQFLQTLLLRNSSKRFLEIGIGESPNIQRIQLMQENKIMYTACDFKSVCDNHRKELESRRIATHDIRFAGNRVGSYSWTLFEMLSRNERYDIIYLDGHHTFYIDLPAFALAHQLLEPGGYFLVDDIKWTLEFLRETFLRSFNDWYFYRKMYNFEEYDLAQQKMPHMKMIAEQYLIKELGYKRLDDYSMPEWWALQKPI
jgi:predicted O-methyltransferase YrrM